MWGIFISSGHFHLAWTFSLHINILKSQGVFSSHVGILTDMYTLYGRYTLHTPIHHHHVSNLAYTLPQQQTSHLTCSPPCENNILHLVWKKSINKVPLRATNNCTVLVIMYLLLIFALKYILTDHQPNQIFLISKMTEFT